MSKAPEDWYKDEKDPIVISLKGCLQGHIMFDLFDRYCTKIDESKHEHGIQDKSEWVSLFYHIDCIKSNDGFNPGNIRRYEESWLYLGEVRSYIRELIHVDPVLDAEETLKDNMDLFETAFSNFLTCVRQFMRDMETTEQKVLLN